MVGQTLTSKYNYEQAVKTFQPYDKVKKQNPDARGAGMALVAEGKVTGRDRKTFIYVNNRLEGNALLTIAAILAEWMRRKGLAEREGQPMSNPPDKLLP